MRQPRPPSLPCRLGRIALLGACALASHAVHALSPSEFFAKVAPSVWRVVTFDRGGMALGTGSAVVVAPHTLITNCHVLKKVHSFQLVNEGRAYIGRLEAWDTPRDVCQVTASMDAPAVEMGDSNKLVVGQPVYTLGAPRNLELTLSNGLVSALRRDANGQLENIQFSAPISHGSSGGGLFDVDGRLIGITSSGFDDSQNLNFALPVAWVRELPARHRAALGKDPRPVAVTAATPQMPVPDPVPPPLPIPEPTPPAPRPAAPPPKTIARTTRTPPSVPAPVIVTAAATTLAPGADRPAANAPPGALPIPFLNEQRQHEYWQYLSDAPYPRACAISDNGHFACSGGNRPRDRSLSPDPKYRALKRCAELAGKPCALYQVDDKVVYALPVPTP